MKPLLAALAFSRVLALCDGTQEAAARYSFQVAYLVPQTVACCCREDGEAFPCTGYTLSYWYEEHSEPDPGSGEDVLSSWELPTPEMGAVVLLNVRSVRANGVMDGGACP
jgi:hypothetical protein